MSETITVYYKPVIDIVPNTIPVLGNIDKITYHETLVYTNAQGQSF